MEQLINNFVQSLKKLIQKEVIVERPVWVIPPYMIYAFKEYGIKEHSPGNNPDVLKYLGSVMSLSGASDEIPWCAAFVNWVMRESEFTHNNSPLARSWLKVGKAHDGFKQFAVVVLKAGTQSWQGHVGFAIAERGDSVYILGGNQNDQVCIKEYPKKDVLGYQIFV